MTDEPDETDRTDSTPKFLGRVSEHLSSRRSFMRNAATVGGGTLALSALGTGTAAAEGHDGDGENGSDGSEEVSDIDVLNYALSLEHLEAAFYNGFLDNHSESDVEGSDVAAYFARPTLRYSTYQQIQDVRDHEEAHVDVLTQTIEDLGGTPVEAAEYEFPYETIEEFVALADRLEAVGVSAYAGAAPLLSNPDLIPPALSIHSVEAEHQTYFQLLHLQRPAPNAFNPARSMDQVIPIAKKFIVGAGGGNRRPFIESAIALDVENQTVTLPLFHGTHDGSPVYYIVTTSSDAEHAERYGVNHAPKLANALGTDAVQQAEMADGTIDFAGTVDFGPMREIEPGPNAFPLDVAQPGAEGDTEYSPLVTTGDDIVMNASHVANDSGVHDSVLDMDRDAMTVTVSMLAGFYETERIQYLGMDSSSPVVATLEKSTLAPNLDAAPGLASNAETSARSAIVPVVNGPLGADNPERQGLRSAVMGEGDPLNVTQTEPGETDYSPIWDVHIAVWTDDAIAAGERERITDTADIGPEIEQGDLTSGGSGPANSSLGGLQAAGFISNCPIVVNLDAAPE